MKALDPSTTNVNELCDWAELRAVLTARRDCTKGDIQQYIKADDYDVESGDIDTSELKESERDERQAVEVIEYARQRSTMLRGKYPFDVDDTRLDGSDLWNGKGELKVEHEAYVYYLLLSALESDSLTPTDRHYFEVECGAVLGRAFSANTFHFGWTRHNASLGKIESRVATLCSRTAIQWKKKAQIDPSYVNQNDVGVDIVLWKDQIDARENTLVLIGQCASGQYWNSKLASNAHNVLMDLLATGPSAPIVRLFCLPFVVPGAQWRKVTVESQSIVFDRIRLVAATQRARGRLFERRNAKWVRRVLRTLSGAL